MGALQLIGLAALPLAEAWAGAGGVMGVSRAAGVTCRPVGRAAVAPRMQEDEDFPAEYAPPPPPPKQAGPGMSPCSSTRERLECGSGVVRPPKQPRPR